MNHQNEEGIPLVATVEPTQATSYSSRRVIGLIVVAALALVSLVAYASVSGESTVTQLITTNLSAKKKSLNEAMLNKVLVENFKPYEYLSSKYLVMRYRTVGHGLKKDGSLDESVKPFFSITLSFFSKTSSGWVSKVRFNRKDPSVQQSKFLLGQMKGMDEDGNIIFVNGAYCEYERGPHYGKIEVLCGDSLKITGAYQKTPCNTYITITTPEQCTDPVTKVTATDLKISKFATMGLGPNLIEA